MCGVLADRLQDVVVRHGGLLAPSIIERLRRRVCDNHPMTAKLQNDSFLRACLCQPTEHTPVWLMRQAGRYLPEYRRPRERAGSFMGLAMNPDHATEVTLQPLERFRSTRPSCSATSRPSPTRWGWA